MTIAGLYLSPEGVVIGADSTSSFRNGNGYHYYNFAQKLFEIGEDSTFALLTWGMGGIGDVSYRALVARLADDLLDHPATSVSDVASRWIDIFWPLFSAYPAVVEANNLDQHGAHDPAAATYPGTRTAEEEARYQNLCRNLAVGFCIAGYVPADRDPEAMVVIFQACAARPVPQPAPRFNVNWWGMPNIMNRVIYGVDDISVESIMASGKWNGTQSELIDVLVANAQLPGAHLPIRDAIDYVHSAIYCTIKAMKFSNHAQVCGGPIELAVITADRKFRWVRHKAWDAAIAEGELY